MPTPHRKFDPRTLIGQTLALSPATLRAWLQIDYWDGQLYEDSNPTSSQTYTMPRPGVAMVSFAGPVGFAPFTWGLTYDHIEAAIAQPLQDLSVRHLVVRAEGPGGTVSGLLSACARIRKLTAQRKIPITVHTSAQCCSAWAFLASTLACNGGQWVAEPTASVGNMGLYRLLDFYGQALEKAGIQIVYVSAGAHKVDLFGELPPSTEALARSQAQVDEIYELLCVDAGMGLAARRGITPQQGYALIRAQESRTYIGNAEAIAAGVIDRVALLDVVLDEAAASGGIV